jgi:hypothetical protein
LDGLVQKRQGQQFVMVTPPGRRPSQVLREPGGLDPAGQVQDRVEIAFIQGFGGAQGHPHSVKNHRVALANRLEVPKRKSVTVSIVVGKNFEPGDVADPGEQFCRVGTAQTQPNALDVSWLSERRHE